MYPNLNYKIIGQGPPIIILHGLFGMLDNWNNFARKLEEAGFMVILIDQRDHGRSDHTDDFSYPLLANDLYNFMSENWIYDSVLIGHSMGGKTSLQFVSQYESMISKLIIVDIGIKKYESGHHDIFKALFSIPIDTITRRKEAEDLLFKELGNERIVQFLMKNLTRTKAGKYEWKMNLPLLYDKYPNILDEIKFKSPMDVDTLFIRGGKSGYISDEDWPGIKKAFTNSTLKTFEDAGHWIHVDKPDELFQTVIDFI